MALFFIINLINDYIKQSNQEVKLCRMLSI